MGKNILVFGGSSGIGKAITKEFVNNNYNAFIIGKTPKGLESVTKEVNIKKSFMGDACNINFLSEVRDYFNKNNIKLDVLVNSIGSVSPKNAEEISIKEWDNDFNNNLNSSFYIFKVLGREIFKSPSKSYNYWFNISSSAGVRIKKDWIAYSLAKHTLNEFTKVLGEELYSKNILVNAIAPGRTKTKMRKALYPNEDQGLLLKPEDIAKFMYMLVSNNTFIYSQIFDLKHP
jgi:short-subunit dehydrogenase